MEGDRYVIHMNGNKICPKCSGTLATFGGNMLFRCIDCYSRFRVVDLGTAECEVVVEEMKKVEMYMI